MGSFTAELWWALIFGTFLFILLAIALVAVVVFNQKRFIQSQKERMNELAENEVKFRTLVGNSRDALFVIQGDRFAFINPKFAELLEYSLDDLNSPSNDFARKAIEKCHALLKDHRDQNAELRFPVKLYSKSNCTFYFDVVLARINWEGQTAILGAMHDVTERTRLEKQLRQAAKMEAIGNLSAGIAHDFNNLLTVINGNAQIILSEVEQDDPIHEEIREILRAGEVAAELTRQLLAFSRRQIQNVRILNINDVISGMKKILERIIPENIKLILSLEENLWNVETDINQIEQVIMNLVINAKDAMPKGGVIKISSSNVELDEEYIDKRDVTVIPGKYVLLSVSDTGSGIPREIRDRIFEPFFTTKERGQGTGLGLSTVYGIVKQNKGYVWVYSEVNIGTTLKVYLPAAMKAVPETAPRNRINRDSLRGNETILIVEDSEAVRNVVYRTLKNSGYRVITAEDGKEALKIAQDQKKIDLLLTDVILPELSGKDVADHLSRMYADLKVVFMSGYDNEMISHGEVLDKGVHFIQKPFSPVSLLQEIRSVLD